MGGRHGVIPVSFDHGGVRVVAAENAVMDACHPYGTVILYPVLYWFCTSDDSAKRDLAAVNDAMIFVCASESRINVFPVDAGRCDNFISRKGDCRSLADCLKWLFLCAAAVSGSIGRYIINHEKPPVILTFCDRY